MKRLGRGLLVISLLAVFGVPPVNSAELTRIKIGYPSPSASFTYDANGNLTSDGTNTYTWNARNQLVSISGGASASSRKRKSART